jgi:hypothetical protein
LGGSDDKLRGEHNGGLDRIGYETLCFDAFHDFAGRPEFSVVAECHARSNHDLGDLVMAPDVLELAFGFTLVSDWTEAPGLGEREERQHHTGVERANEQLFGRPVIGFSLELRRAADDDVVPCLRRQNAAPRRSRSFWPCS